MTFSPAIARAEPDLTRFLPSSFPPPSHPLSSPRIAFATSTIHRPSRKPAERVPEPASPSTVFAYLPILCTHVLYSPYSYGTVHETNHRASGWRQVAVRVRARRHEAYRADAPMGSRAHGLTGSPADGARSESSLVPPSLGTDCVGAPDAEPARVRMSATQRRPSSPSLAAHRSRNTDQPSGSVGGNHSPVPHSCIALACKDATMRKCVWSTTKDADESNW